MLKTFFSISSLTLLGYLVSLLNQGLIAKELGTSVNLDSYLYALSIIGFCTFFAYPMMESTIPIYFRKRETNIAEGNEIFSRAVNTLLISCFVLLAFIFLVLPKTIHIIVGTSLQAKTEEILNLTQYLAPSIILTSFTLFLQGVLNSGRRFVLQSIGKILGIFIGSIFLFSFLAKIKTEALIFNFYAVLVMSCLFQLVELYKMGVRYNPTAGIMVDRSFWKMFFVSGNVYLVGLAYGVLENRVFSQFSHGLISSFSYASKLLMITQHVVFGSIINICWTRILEKKQSHGEVNSIKDLFNVACFVCGISLVIGVTLAVFSKQIVYILFFRGAFDQQSLEVTSGFFQLIVLSLPFSAMYDLFQKTFSTLQKAKMVGINGIIFNLTLFVFCYLSVATLDLHYLILSRGIAYIVMCCLSFYILGKYTQQNLFILYARKIIYWLPCAVALYIAHKLTEHFFTLDDKVLLLLKMVLFTLIFALWAGLQSWREMRKIQAS
ncbi:MAG: hypothetical protein A2X86_12255 [Bdellovibrionales bacterium GWA2_49_15]|nr:MAG: hypothetical protein A2X86_12255 [Bdellovibrionales bacterium GWA2_49_15]